jgi:hypothetical protein
MLPTYRSALALLSLRRFCLALMLSGATLSAGLGSSPAAAGPNSEAKARATANQLIEALSQKNGQQLFNLLGGPLRSNTSPSQLQGRLNSQPKLQEAKLQRVLRGLDTSVVEIELRTEKGIDSLRLVVDSNGKLLGYELGETTETIDRIARAFVEDLGAGRWLSARSRLVLSLQDSLNGTQLENRWKELEKRTGAFRRITAVVTASAGGPQQLVLVTTQFSNLNDSLFVILDDKNRITGVDFPLQRSDH